MGNITRKKIFAFSILIVFILAFLNLRNCTNFSEKFVISAKTIENTISFITVDDIGIPITIVRFFHNKLTYLFLQITQSYINYLDIAFLLNILSIVGTIGFASAFFFFLEKYQKKGLIILLGAILAIVVIVKLTLLLKFPFLLKSLLLLIPYYIFSWWGLNKLNIWLNHKYPSKFIYPFWFLLILLSIGWLFYFSSDIGLICERI